MIIQPVEALDSTTVSVAYKLNGDSLTIVIAPPWFAPNRNIRQNNQELIVWRKVHENACHSTCEKVHSNSYLKLLYWFGCLV